MRHNGFSFVHAVSPCPEFNNTFGHFDEVSAELPAGHDKRHAASAIAMAMSEEKLYLGVFYQVERPTFDERSAHLAEPHHFDAEEFFGRCQ